MAVVQRRQPSTLVSNGLAAATVALNIAGVATDAVPIAKQILNCAAHISAAAERIHKKREAMYLLVEKVDIYATQIDIAVAGRILDASLQRRLKGLYSVFLKIQALVEAKAGNKNNALTRAWRNVVTKPNRAETLAVELEREIQLFQLLTGIQLSLVVDNTARAVDDTARAVDDTARAVAADASYDDQLRLLRDCDIDKRNIIRRCETDEGTVVWASARVDGQLFVIRYLESESNAEIKTVKKWTGVMPMWGAKYSEYLKNIKKVSTVRGSHPNIVQLYGRHVQGPEAVFRAGTFELWDYLKILRPREGTVQPTSRLPSDKEGIALKMLILAYKILVLSVDCSLGRLSHSIQDASSHLESAHGLTWKGYTAIVDENGEPRIGLFDDIARADPDHSPFPPSWIYFDILMWPNASYSEETGVVEQVHKSSLHAVITEQLRDGNDTDPLQRVWDIVQQEQLDVRYWSCVFPVLSGNLSLSQELIARARLCFETKTNGKDPLRAAEYSFVRNVVVGRGTDTSSPMYLFMWREGEDRKCNVEVETCTQDNSHIRYDCFNIHIPDGSPLLAEVARAVGLPDDFEHSWDGSKACIYPQFEDEGEQVENQQDRDGEGTDEDPGDSDAWRWGSSEEDDEYKTADEGNEL